MQLAIVPAALVEVVDLDLILHNRGARRFRRYGNRLVSPLCLAVEKFMPGFIVVAHASMKGEQIGPWQPPGLSLGVVTHLKRIVGHNVVDLLEDAVHVISIGDAICAKFPQPQPPYSSAAQKM
jgi:hypothetical protein